MMKGIKIFFYVVVGFLSLLVVGTLIFFLAEGAITSLKNPEWTKFRREMVNAYPEIVNISTFSVGADFCIHYDLNKEPKMEAAEIMFDKTKEFILSGPGFENIRGSLGTIEVTFDNRNLEEDHIVFSSEGPRSDCTAQDFWQWTVQYRGKMWDYEEAIVTD